MESHSPEHAVIELWRQHTSARNLAVRGVVVFALTCALIAMISGGDGLWTIVEAIAVGGGMWFGLAAPPIGALRMSRATHQLRAIETARLPAARLLRG